MTAKTDITQLTEAWEAYAVYFGENPPKRAVWVPNEDGTGILVYPGKTSDDLRYADDINSLASLREMPAINFVGLLRAAVSEGGATTPTVIQAIEEILDRHQIVRTKIAAYWTTAA